MQPHDDEQPRCVTELLKKDYAVAKLDNTLAQFNSFIINL